MFVQIEYEEVDVLVNDVRAALLVCVMVLPREPKCVMNSDPNFILNTAYINVTNE